MKLSDQMVAQRQRNRGFILTYDTLAEWVVAARRLEGENDNLRAAAAAYVEWRRAVQAQLDELKASGQGVGGRR